MSAKTFSIVTASILIILGIVGRFAPHPANFTPIAAVALFAGVFLPRRYAIIVPLAAMVISDLIIGLHDLILFTWGSFALVGMIGWWIRTRRSARRIVAGSLGASFLFFLVTNWAVMQFGAMYPHSLEGLMASYAAGLPFFRNMLAGDLFFSGALFGLMALAVRARMRYSIRNQVS